MKKFVLSFLLLFLLGGFGSFIIGTAHAADTAMTPAEAATLSQSLQVLKAKLLDLQAQAAAQAQTQTQVQAQTIAPAPVVAQTVVVPATQNVATVAANLQTLTAAFAKLNQSIAANPGALTPANRTALQSILGGMRASLIAMNQSLVGGGAATGQSVALAPTTAVSPSVTPAAPAASPVASISAQAVPSVGTQVQPAAITAVTNPAPQTAQASSQFPLSRGWMVTLGIIVILLIIYAIWRSSENKKETGKKVHQNTNATPTAPKAVPMPLVQKQTDTKIVNQHEVTTIAMPPNSNHS
jgi:hypothetical protein